MNIRIIEILQEGISEDKEIIWLKYKTKCNNIIAFWGEFDSPNRNIVALRSQELPMDVEILAPEDCIPTEHEKASYKLNLSVPSNVCIQINPEL